jgi:hypothetical protein
LRDLAQPEMVYNRPAPLRTMLHSLRR